MTIIEHNTDTRKMPDEERTLPTSCPPWCRGDHEQELAEGASIVEASQHHATLGDTFLAELRNGVDGRVWRPGCGSYQVDLEQDPHPYLNDRNSGGPLVRLAVSPDLSTPVVEVRLTSGEARTVAALLIRAADRADFDA